MCLQILVRKPGVKRKLKWSSERKGLDGFICLRIEFGARNFENSNEISGSMNCGKLCDWLINC